MTRERERELSLDPFRGASWIDRLVLPFVREPTLWPILLVVIAHAVAFLAPVLVLGLRDGHRAAQVGVVLALAASAAAVLGEWRRTRRLGPWAGLVASTWVLSVAAAVFGHAKGLL